MTLVAMLYIRCLRLDRVTRDSETAMLTFAELPRVEVRRAIAYGTCGRVAFSRRFDTSVDQYCHRVETRCWIRPRACVIPSPRRAAALRATNGRVADNLPGGDRRCFGTSALQPIQPD